MRVQIIIMLLSVINVYGMYDSEESLDEFSDSGDSIICEYVNQEDGKDLVGCFEGMCFEPRPQSRRLGTLKSAGFVCFTQLRSSSVGSEKFLSATAFDKEDGCVSLGSSIYSPRTDSEFTPIDDSFGLKVPSNTLDGNCSVVENLQKDHSGRNSACDQSSDGSYKKKRFCSDFKNESERPVSVVPTVQVISKKRSMDQEDEDVNFAQNKDKKSSVLVKKMRSRR